MSHNLQKPLSDRHKMFCECYLIHFVGSRAAVEAGFLESNAKTRACELLADPPIREYLRKRTAEIMSEIKAEQLKIFRELMKVGHSKILDLYNPNGTLKALEDWPDDIASCVSSIKQKIRTIKVGTKEVKQITLEVKLWNKNHALDILTKVTGLQTSELKIALPDNVGALYFPQPKEIGAPVDEKIIARDKKLRLIQGERTANDQDQRDKE